MKLFYKVQTALLLIDVSLDDAPGVRRYSPYFRPSGGRPKIIRFAKVNNIQ
jgi:hypothetical protein